MMLRDVPLEKIVYSHIRPQKDLNFWLSCSWGDTGIEVSVWFGLAEVNRPQHQLDFLDGDLDENNEPVPPGLIKKYAPESLQVNVPLKSLLYIIFPERGDKEIGEDVYDIFYTLCAEILAPHSTLYIELDDDMEKVTFNFRIGDDYGASLEENILLLEEFFSSTY